MTIWFHYDGRPPAWVIHGLRLSIGVLTILIIGMLAAATAHVVESSIRIMPSVAEAAVLVVIGYALGSWILIIEDEEEEK